MANSRNPLQNVKRLLLGKKKQVERELESLKKDDPYLVEDRLISNEPATDAQEYEGHERIMAQTAILNRLLAQIKKALSRIGIGKYGKCERCAKVIELERLKAFPAATLCLKCESELEKMGRA